MGDRNIALIRKLVLNKTSFDRKVNEVCFGVSPAV